MPATAINAPPITVEQYEGFEGYPGLRDELIYGRIVLSPQPKPSHQFVVKKIERLLDAALDGTLYEANQNSNIRFASMNSMPAPDVFVVETEVWLAACRTETYVAQPPLLAVEVLSPANRKRHVSEKVELYLSAGVRVVWVVFPKQRSVDVYELDRPAHTERDVVWLPEPLQGSLSVPAFFLPQHRSQRFSPSCRI